MKEIDVTTSPADEPEETSGLPELKAAEKALFAIGGLLATAVSVLGLLSSFKTLALKAGKGTGGWGWDWPWMLPLGIDLAIPAFTLAALFLIRINMPLMWVAVVPRALTAATVYLNWSAAHGLPGQIGHATLTLLWVVFSEIAGHVYASYINAVTDERIEKIRRIRWVLAPVSTLVMWRYMRLWESRGYKAVVSQRREATVFRSRMRAEHGWLWRRRSDLANEKLALKLARVGVAIADTLDAPRREAEARRLAEEKQQEEARVAEEKRLAAVEERRLREEQEDRDRRLADAHLDAQLAEIERAKRAADDLLAAEAWKREQQQRLQEQAAVAQTAALAKERAEALKVQREETDRLREAAARRAMAAATETPRRAPQPPTTERHESATQSATEGAPMAPRADESERPRGATEPATKAPRKTPSGRPSKDPRGAAKDAIKALYATLGRRPLESEMVAALKKIRSPHGSRQFANKLRAEIETEHPELAALGSDNVRPLTGS